MTVQTVKIKFFPKQHIPTFIQNGNQMKLVVLVFKLSLIHIWYRRLLKRLRLCWTTAHRTIRMCLSTMSRSAMPKKMTRWIYTAHPVSYTHLDVYKRQVQRQCAGTVLWCRQFHGSGAGQHGKDSDVRCGAAVSYTHLDVYKRQVCSSPSLDYVRRWRRVAKSTAPNLASR